MSKIIEINQSNLHSGIFDRYKEELHSSINWHKVIVENVNGLDRFTVLNIIMKYCYPLHFIPVEYTYSGGTAQFYLKNCGPAIERMCKENLNIENHQNKDKPFKISVQLSATMINNVRVNVQENIIRVLNKRYNGETGALDLDNFVKDEGLDEFCPLSQPKLLFFILHLSMKFSLKFIKLSNNEIESLKPMEAIWEKKTLTGIDLRNNNIISMSEIINLQRLKLKELWLDGNPLCDDFNEISYNKVAKNYLDTLQKLDGLKVQKTFLPFKRNFLCSQSGFNLVDQFLEHYFTLYDSQNRGILDGLYHKEAMLSITTNYLPLESTSLTARLRAYKKVSRNLLQTSIGSKNDKFLFAGPRDILKVLSSLPASQHDPFSFAVDLISHNDKLAILAVTGVFRELQKCLYETGQLLSFTRTFVLLPAEEGEYLILNEMVHICNATTSQTLRAFKLVRALKPDQIIIPQPRNANEMLHIVKVMNVLTRMNMEWSKKCLKECNYNLEKALSLFVELYKMNKIPESAFKSNAPPGTKCTPNLAWDECYTVFHVH